MSDQILVEQVGAVATVVLNRPQSHNAITIDMYRSLPEVLGGLDADRAVKVVVLRGAGQKAFASGADISEFERERGDAESARGYNEHVAAAEHALAAMTKPTVAMVHGYCIGAAPVSHSPATCASPTSGRASRSPRPSWGSSTASRRPSASSTSSARRGRPGSSSPASRSRPSGRAPSACSTRCCPPTSSPRTPTGSPTW